MIPGHQFSVISIALYTHTLCICIPCRLGKNQVNGHLIRIVTSHSFRSCLRRCVPHFMSMSWSKLILWPCTRLMEVVGSVIIAMLRAVQLCLHSIAAYALLTCAIHACTCSFRTALQHIDTLCNIWKQAGCFIKIGVEFGDALFVKAQVTVSGKHSPTTAPPVRALTFAETVLSQRSIQFTSMYWTLWTHRLSICKLVAVGYVTSVAIQAGHLRCKW